MKNEDYKCEVMGVVGFTIAALQRMESTLGLCWLAFGKKEEVDGQIVYAFNLEIDEMWNKNEKKTLGGLFAAIKDTGHFTKNFEKRFERLVDNRNRLIHRIFNEPSYISLNNKRSLVRLHRFTSKLLSEALYFGDVFDTYLGIMFEVLYNNDPLRCEGAIDKMKKVNRIRRESGMFDEVYKHIRR